MMIPKQQDNRLQMPCLARYCLSLLKPHRQAFYDSFAALHSSAYLQYLQHLVKLEYSRFEGWCLVTGCPSSYFRIAEFLAFNPPMSRLTFEDYQRGLNHEF